MKKLNNGYNEDEARLLIKSIEETVKRAKQYIDITDHLMAKDRKKDPHINILLAFNEIHALSKKIELGYIKGRF